MGEWQNLVKEIKASPANWITLLRLLGSFPILFYLIAADKKVWALFAFALLALTDFLDGAVAKIFGYVSNVGKILDPLADKVLIFSFLFVFWLNGLIPNGLQSRLLILLFFESILIAIGYFAYRDGLSTKISVKLGANWFGKIKFTLEVIFGLLLFSYALGHGDSFSTVGIALWASRMYPYSFAIDSSAILLWAIIFAILSILGHSMPFWLPKRLSEKSVS